MEPIPESKHIEFSENSIVPLRNKLAKKEFEAGRMYLKLEEYDSALIYFNEVINQYYDTVIADDARIFIIFTHVLKNDRKSAFDYYNYQKKNFSLEKKSIEAKKLLDDTDGGLGLSQYYKLFK